MADDLRAWWGNLLGPAPGGIRGLWFGLVELVPGSWHLYVVGTVEFDADDETAEWAVGPYRWAPENRYFPVPEIGALDLGEAVHHAAEKVRSLHPWEDLDVDGVAVGFDDGDFELVFRG